MELLNRDLKVVDYIEGNLLSDNFSCTGESKIRRSYNCEFIMTGSSFTVGQDKNIWIDRYIRVYYGIKHQRSQEIIWYLLGTMSFIDINYSYSSRDRKISLTCMDMMAEYDGTKNGMIQGQKLIAPAGQDIRTTIIALLNSAGIKNYMVDDIGKEVPYDLEWGTGSTYVQALTELCELYDSWEFFFDEEGTFIWRKIPTGFHDQHILDSAILAPLVISESLQDSFQGVYNATEVWGQVLDLAEDDRFASTSTYTNHTYNITLSGITDMDSIDNFTYIAIRITTANQGNDFISINGLERIPIVNDNGDAIPSGRLKANTDYVFRYRRTLGTSQQQKNFYLLGQYQAYGYYEETSRDYPYSITNLGYRILNVIDKPELYSDDLCQNQAEFETYQTSIKKHTLNLATIIIPFLEPNQKIEYRSKSTGLTEYYMIKDFSWRTMDGTMSITLYKFNEDYSYVYNRK